MGRHGVRSADAPHIREVLDVLLDPMAHRTIDRWRLAVVRRLRTLLGSDHASFQMPGVDGVLLYSDTVDAEFLTRYASRFMPELMRTKAYARRMVEIGVGNRVRLWGADLDWLYGSAYYNDLLQPGGLLDPIWAAVPVEGHTVPAVLLGHHESSKGKRFGKRGIDIMEILRPALRAAVTTVRHVTAHRTTLGRSLDSLSVGAVLVGRTGKIRHQNPVATRILEEGPAGELVLAAVLSMASDARHSLTARRIESAFPDPRTITVGTVSYRASATSTASLDLGERNAVLIFLENATEEQGPAVLADRWRLTRRQAEVAVLLAERKTDPEIAHLLGVSVYTARHHAEAVLGRLGLRSRRDVAERLASDPSVSG
jgi:DNA-binding CsgD family transcriptional regulator